MHSCEKFLRTIKTRSKIKYKTAADIFDHDGIEIFLARLKKKSPLRFEALEFLRVVKIVAAGLPT
jgi:hypothetical protein